MEANGVPQKVLEVRNRHIQIPIQTNAKKLPDGKVLIMFVVQECGEAVAREFPVEKPGQEMLRNVLTGGLTIPDAPNIPEDL